MRQPADAIDCVVCARTSPAGLVICPECGGTVAPVADTLLFVDPGEARRGSTDLHERLLGVAGPGSSPDLINATVRGEKALTRLPATSVGLVSAWLASHGIPTRTVVTRRAWAALPAAFLATLGAVLLAGMLAGVTYSAWMLLATPLFVYLLATSAARGACLPLVGSERPGALPALDGYNALLRAAVELTPGRARDLAASLARAARGVAGPDPEFPVSSALSVELDAVLKTAAEAARDVAVLDETMESFVHRENDATRGSWVAGREEVRGARSRLESYLLEATGLVARLQGLGAEAFDSAGQRLRELVRDLREASGAAVPQAGGLESVRH